MCIALPMFTNVSIDWKLPSYKIPPLGTPLPSSQDLRDLFVKAIRSQTFLPLNTSKFKDIALVYR